MTYGERITVYAGHSLAALRWRYVDRPDNPDALTPDTGPATGEFRIRTQAGALITPTAQALDRALSSPVTVEMSTTTWDGFAAIPFLVQGPDDPANFAPMTNAVITLREAGPLVPAGDPLVAVTLPEGGGPYTRDVVDFPTKFTGRPASGTLTRRILTPIPLYGLTARFEDAQSRAGREYWAQDVGGDVRWDYERVFSDPIETASLKLRWTDAIAPGDFLQWRGQLYRIDLVETEGRRRSMTLACSRLAE